MKGVFLAVAITTLVATGAARAQAPGPRTVGVLKIEVAGNSSDELRGQVAAALAAAVKGAGATLVGADKVEAAIGKDKQLAQCLSATCLEKLGALVGASELLRA